MCRNGHSNWAYNFYALQDAYNQVVIAQDKEGLKFMTQKLLKEYQKWRSQVNMKTQDLYVGNNNFKNLQTDENQKIGACTDYQYLGVELTAKDGIKDTIKTRIVEA